MHLKICMYIRVASIKHNITFNFREIGSISIQFLNIKLKIDVELNMIIYQ